MNENVSGYSVPLSSNSTCFDLLWIVKTTNPQLIEQVEFEL